MAWRGNRATCEPVGRTGRFQQRHAPSRAVYRFNRVATRERNEKLLMRGFINKIIITISERILQRRTLYDGARETRRVQLAIAIRLSRGIVYPGVVESRDINVKPF